MLKFPGSVNLGRRQKRRLLHTSDLHLDLLGDKACQSLETLVNLAKKLKVDLVIIAGDFFDHNRVDDNLVIFAIEELNRLAVPVVILPGNHDSLVPGSVFNRKNLWDSCPNVQIIREPSGQTIIFHELGISVWGRPIISYSGDTQPLTGTVSDHNGFWHVGVAHGSYANGEEIAASGSDYIALGHWPNFRCVCSSPAKAYYCDSPSMLFPESTVNIIDLVDGEEVKVMPYSLQHIENLDEKV